MKFRIIVLVAGMAFALAACSLADDITPPPGYIPPTPEPTLGLLFPAVPPSPAEGFAIYAQECAPCHGETGLGNGPMASRLPVAVPAIGLREISSQATPADWFTLVTRGRLDRGMPPFISLSAAEKWDVLAYIFTLSSTSSQQRRGADLYAANCSECHGLDGRLDPNADLSDPAFMAQATGIGMARLIAGESGMDHPSTGQFTEDDLWSLVGHVRSLAFDLNPLAAAPEPTRTAEEASPTPGSAQETASPEVTGPDASPTTDAQTLVLTGTVDNVSGTGLTPGLVATLHLHDTIAGEDVQAQTAPVASDGTYRFDGVQADTSLAYWVSVDYADVTYNSQPVVYDGTNAAVESQVSVYDSTRELTSLTLDQVHINFDFTTDGVVQVVEIYVLSNSSSLTVVVPTDGENVPFIQVPAGAVNPQYQLASGSAPLMSATEGFGMMPSSGQYGIVAFYSLPYSGKLEFSHHFSLPVVSVVIFAPEGVRVQSDLLTDSGTQDFQGQTFRLYQVGNLASGSTFSIDISGKPGAGAGTAPDKLNDLLIGLAALGIALIGAGAFLYLRDRQLARKMDAQGDEAGEDALGEDKDAILDAIIALDDQYKAGGLLKGAYEKRREELKNRLKGKVY